MGKQTKQLQKLGKKSEMPQGVKPMLATLLKEPFQDEKFIYEIKWDGYRIIAYKKGKSVKLESRSQLDYSKKYPPIIQALSKLKYDAVLDGEAVVLNKAGRPDFDALQKFNGQQSGVFYYVFDLLWIDGVNIMHLPLVQRKMYLDEIINDNPIIKISDHFDNGIALFEEVKKLGLEGIVAKRRESKYLPDKRGNDWFKIPYEVKQEFVIGGWVESEKRVFRTLLFGSHDEKGLKWIGHAGGGYKEKDMPGILKRLKALEIKKSPFYNAVEYDDGTPHYVRPELVANIKYATFTKSGKIRKPAIFLGFRDDKKAQQVVEEKPNTLGKKKTKFQTAKDSNWPFVEAQEIRNKDVFDIEGDNVTLYNVDWELWKGITKADLIQYYHSVSKFILPHLKNRPLSLHVKIKGPYAQGFYIKDMEDREPPFAQIFRTKRLNKNEGMREIIDYLVCNRLATLLYAINIPTIDVNPWTSTTDHPDNPDYVIIDLDPSDNEFSKTIEPALAAKELFDQKKIKSFVKTSGKTGMHIFIPCSDFSFEQARTIANRIASEINSVVPLITTTEFSKNARGNKVYLDVNQNDFADTVAAPYSVRPYRRPNVSTPLEWREVKPALSQNDFTIKNALERFNKKGDLFEGVLDRTIAEKNNKPLKQFL